MLVTRVEIYNIIPPGDIKSAMENQIKSERERRSAVLHADGEREAAIIRSRGDAAKVRTPAMEARPLLRSPSLPLAAPAHFAGGGRPRVLHCQGEGQRGCQDGQGHSRGAQHPIRGGGCVLHGIALGLGPLCGRPSPHLWDSPCACRVSPAVKSSGSRAVDYLTAMEYLNALKGVTTKSGNRSGEVRRGVAEGWGGGGGEWSPCTAPHHRRPRRPCSSPWRRWTG